MRRVWGRRQRGGSQNWLCSDTDMSQRLQSDLYSDKTVIYALTTRRPLGGAHVGLPPTMLFPRLAVNKTSLKPCVRRRAPNICTWDFPDVIKFRVAAHTISENAIRFRHTDYNPDRAQKLISSSTSRHLLTRNISSKSMHAFLSNLAHRQTETNASKNIHLILCRRKLE